jgi:hypothetical protein
MTSRFIGVGGDLSTSKKISGMPIMVDRPKWLKATYKTTRVALMAPGKAEENQAATFTVLRETGIQKVDFDVVSVAEAYALDLKRPMAGTADWDIQFPEGKQYPKEVKNKVEDKSVAEVAAALEKVAASAAKIAMPAKPQSSDDENAIRTVTLGETVDRVEFFDIDNIDRGPVLILDSKGSAISRRYDK